MDIHRIRSREVQNLTRIFFYREGDAWRAYDRSAWYACQQLEVVKPVQSISLGGERTVFITIAPEELEALLADCFGVEKHQEEISLPVRVPFDVHAYYRWREPFRLNVKSAVKDNVSAAKDRVWNELRRFDWSITTKTRSSPSLKGSPPSRPASKTTDPLLPCGLRPAHRARTLFFPALTGPEGTRSRTIREPHRAL